MGFGELKEIWVAGCPSLLGGADTELYHQIVLWRKYDIAVHIVPNRSTSLMPFMQSEMQRLGCYIHEYRADIFKDRVVVCFCNGTALARLPEIYAEGKPKAFIFFNCMTWTFPTELVAIRNKQITHCGYVSQYQRKYLLAEYERQKVTPPTDIGYCPYFAIELFQPVEKSQEYFGVGRISRQDPAKFSSDCWKIFADIQSPIPKKVFVLGYGDNVRQKIGNQPQGMDCKTWPAGAIRAEELYSKIDVMIHKTGGSRESYCRVLLEAMAYGVVPLVENDYAFPELLTGSMKWLMCKSSDEMSSKATELANDRLLLNTWKRTCRQYVEQNFSNAEKSLAWIRGI